MNRILILTVFFSAFILTGHVFAEEDSHSSHHEHHKHEDMNKEPLKELSDDSIYNLDSKWKDQSGKEIKLSDFRGRPLVASMVFTSCQAACPITTTDMKKIESALPERQRDQVRFVLISMDPARDTVDALKKYQKKRDLSERRWSLLTSNNNTVRDTAAVLGVTYRKLENGDFSHSNIIFIVDKEGVIKHRQVGLGTKPDESVKVLKSLLK